MPYRHQLNFTFDGLAESHSAVERLRTFRARMVKGGFPDGINTLLAEQTGAAVADFTAALADDLNTAEARAAIFELVRVVNTAADHGTLCTENVAPILHALARFDEIFAVLDDRDLAITRQALDWAEREGRLDDAAPELRVRMDLSDAAIDSLIEERNQARHARNFARADANPLRSRRQRHPARRQQGRRALEAEVGRKVNHYAGAPS